MLNVNRRVTHDPYMVVTCACAVKLFFLLKYLFLLYTKTVHSFILYIRISTFPIVAVFENIVSVVLGPRKHPCHKC